MPSVLWQDLLLMWDVKFLLHTPHTWCAQRHHVSWRVCRDENDV